MTDSHGRDHFVDRFGLWSESQRDAGMRVTRLAEEQGLNTVRLSFADQHGVLRGKSVVASSLGDVLRNGCTITTTLLAKDTSHRTVYPVWQSGGGFSLEAMTGGGDVVMVPDPTTFRILPWLERTGWMLCDLYFQDGTAVPLSTRAICRQATEQLAEHDYGFVSGLEVELHIFKLEDPRLEPEHATQPGAAPRVSLLTQGFQYLTEDRLDDLEPTLDLLRDQLEKLELPLRSMEVEFGPSQCELTLHPQPGIATADSAVLLRSAVKQICRRQGLHATFMCRPAISNVFSSGWHLHQSLVNASGNNVFVPDDDQPLSITGRQYVAGVLQHARAACAFTTPTLNGYKRFKPYSLAPDRLSWGRDNRGSMLRVIGGNGDPGTRIENRVGDPAANPYLYLTSQMLSGLHGIVSQLEPPPISDTPYDTAAEPLPASLMEALDALDADTMFRATLGDFFVDYILHIKRAEIARFLSEVTDWEQREYFQLF